jgi:hypothetical protein
MTGQLQAPLPLASVEGAAQEWEFTVTRDGAALNVTGMSVYFNVVKRVGRAPAITTEGGSPNATTSIPTGTDGKVVVAVASGVTDGMAGDWYYQLDVEDGDGNIVSVAFGAYSIQRSAR